MEKAGDNFSVKGVPVLDEFFLKLSLETKAGSKLCEN